MGTLTKYGTNNLSGFYDAPEGIYGTGNDGNVTFDGSSTVLSITPSGNVYELTRDIHCYNMTIGQNIRVQPNGYRIFVKNLLIMGEASEIGWASTTGWSTMGSIGAGGAAGQSVTHSLGGSGGGIGSGTATPPTALMGGSDYYKQPINAVNGYSVNAAGGPTFLMGGAGGTSGPGGGVIIVAARYIQPPVNYSYFRADGDGGSFGGGGVIIVVSSSPQPPTSQIYFSTYFNGTSYWIRTV